MAGSYTTNDLMLLNQLRNPTPLDNMKFGLDTLSTLGGLLTGFQGLNQAKKQFAHQQAMDLKNLQNSVQSYNTSLSDRINARAAQQGNLTAQDVAQYKALNSLKA